MHEQQHNSLAAPLAKIILLDPTSATKAQEKPEKSSLDAYEQAFGKT